MWNSSFRHSSSFLFFLLLFFLFFLRSSFSRPFLQTQIKNNPQPKSKITPQIHNISARSINPNPKITISTPKQLSQLCTRAAQVCCFSLVLLLVFVVFWVCCLWWYCCLVLLFSIFQVCCLRKWVWRFECQRDRLDARFWVRVREEVKAEVEKPPLQWWWLGFMMGQEVMPSLDQKDEIKVQKEIG